MGRLWRKSSRMEFFFGTRLNDVRRPYRDQEAPFIYLFIYLFIYGPCEYSVVDTFHVKQMNFQ